MSAGRAIWHGLVVSVMSLVIATSIYETAIAVKRGNGGWAIGHAFLTVFFIAAWVLIALEAQASRVAS